MRIKIFAKKEKKEGYAILFTIIIISVIAIITAGLTSSATKQLILSSLARDSQLSFYQSDMATDCALYADQIEFQEDPTFYQSALNWSCGDKNLGVTYTDKVGGSFTANLNPPDPNSTDPCFRIEINKTFIGPGIYSTKIFAKGYNICKKDSVRTVEREIEINY